MRRKGENWEGKGGLGSEGGWKGKGRVGKREEDWKEERVGKRRGWKKRGWLEGKREGLVRPEETQANLQALVV